MDSDTIRSARHRPLLALAAAMIVLAVVSVVGLLVDPRALGSEPIWAKPFKFAVSLAIYGPTLGWMISLLTGRARRVAARAGTVVALAAGLEMIGIVTQVVRGRPSHFNVSTPFDATLFGVMGVVITVLWVANAVIAVALLRERGLPAATAVAVRLGLGVALLGMLLAFLMTNPGAVHVASTGPQTAGGGHTVGTPPGGPGLPLLGWSTTGGDLRIGHFVGLHALQGLPLIALALGALARRVPALAPERVRARLVGVAGLAWAAMTLLLTWQALRAQPLLAPDGTTLLAAGALVVVTLAAVAVVVTRGTTNPTEPRVLERA